MNQRERRADHARTVDRKKTVRNVAFGLVVLVVIGALVGAAQSGLFSGVDIQRDKKGPDFTVTGSEGETFHLAETNGTARVLFFMTSADWCQPCKIMTRGPLREIQAKYGENVTMISLEMIPQDYGDADLNAYKQQFNATWVHARDTQGIATDYGVKFLSTVVILDQEGFVKYTGSDPPASTMSSIIEEMGIRPQGD